jgi:hypothetical protein
LITENNFPGNSQDGSDEDTQVPPDIELIELLDRVEDPPKD